MKNEDMEAAENELAEHGIHVAPIRGGKHWQYRWPSLLGDRECFVTVAGTPSDCRGPANTRSDVRKELKRGGYITDQPKTETAIRPPTLAQRLATAEGHVIDLLRRMAALEADRIEPRLINEAKNVLAN